MTVADHSTRLAVLEIKVDSLTNPRSGRVVQLEEDVRNGLNSVRGQVSDQVKKYDKLWRVVTVVLIVDVLSHAASGTGTFSLKSLLDFLGR
jgi:hypothetical protein